MTENMKRKITVEPSTSKSKDTLRRPSVFERLGTKASATGTSNAAPPSTGKEGASSACRHWAQSGSCPYGKNCKNAVTHILISPSKQRAAKKDETKVKTTGNTGNTLLPLKPGSILKDDINKRLHSMVVKKSRTGGSPDMNWENWDQTDLEYEDEKVLEKRRQLLQRELELQMSREKSEQKTKKVKKVKKGVSSSSSTSASSSSSTESTSSSDDSSSTSSSTSTDSRRKKTKTKSGKRASSSSTSGADRAAAKKKAAKATNAASPSGGKKAPAARKEEQKSAPAASSKRRASPASKKPSGLPVAPSAAKKRSATPSSRPRRRSATPQRSTDKDKAAPTGKKPATRQNQSPVARRASSLDKKDKGNQGASPRNSARDREREKIKDKDREKDKEREKEKERDKGKGQGAGRSRSPAKGKGKDRPASPRRNSRPRDPRRKDSPAAGGSKDNKGGRASTPCKSRPHSPSRGRGRDGSGERKTAASKVSPGVALSNDRRDGNRNDSRDARDRDNGSKKNDYDNRKGDTVDKGPRGKETAVTRGGGNRLRDEPVNNRRDGDSTSTRENSRKIVPPKSVSDRDLKGDKDRTGSSKDPRSNSRDARDIRDNVDPRLTRNLVQNLREMKEADREKEREEALERCRERQRERDRKAREDKAREDKAREEKLARENEKAARDHQKAAREHERELPSLLMISTRNPIKSNSSQSNGGREGSKGLDKGSERGSDRSHDKERGSDKDRDLDKSKSFDRDRGIDRDRGSNRGLDRDRPGDRDRGLVDRGMPDRERPPDRDRVSDRASDRGHERDRGFDRGPEHDRANDRDRAGPPDRDRVGPDRDRVGLERDRAPERERLFERERNDRPPAKGPHDRGPNRAIPDRAYDRGLDRGFDREAERGGGFDRGHLESERDYPRGRDDGRRPPPEEKGPGGFDSPYDARRGREERGRYGEQIDRGGRYEDQGPPRDEQRRPVGDNRPFQDDRRGGRRDGRTSLEPQWETRNDPDSRRRPPGYDREEPRSPGPAVKGRDWDTRDYPDGGRRDWDGRGPRRGPPLDWDDQRRGEWIDKDAAHPPIEDDWDVYAGVNAPGDWGAGGGEGWPPPDDWERPPPRSAPGRLPPPRLPPHRDEVPGGGGYVQPPLRDIKLEEPPPPEEGKELPPAPVSSIDKLAPKEDDPAAPVAPASKVPSEVPEPPAGGLKRPRESSDGEGDKPEPKRVCLEDSLPLEEDLSDISDDDADEILNREDVEVASPVEPLVLAPAQLPANVSAAGGEMPRSLADHEPERMERPAVAVTIDANRDSSDQQSLLPQDEDTMDNLDFEEISDEELEEEAKAGLGDALGVDWASLVAESRPRVRTEALPGSGRRRWEGCHMLARLGISFEYAGPELVARVTAQMKAASGEGKGEEEELALLHPVALMHVALREKRERRKALFASAGPYKRALSARRDLMIRRQLCNLPSNETTVDGQGANAEDVYRHAVQLFVRGLA